MTMSQTMLVKLNVTDSVARQIGDAIQAGFSFPASNGTANSQAWTEGSSVTSANINCPPYAALRTLAPSSSETISLSSLAVRDGNLTANLTSVNALMILIPAATDQSRTVTLGGAAALAFDSMFSGTVPMKGSAAGVDVFMRTSSVGGFTTASKTNLKIANGDTANSLVYSIFISGVGSYS